MADSNDRPEPSDPVAGLKSRSAALRRAATNPRAKQEQLLDAALTELEGAIDVLSAAGNGGSGRGDQSGSAHSERRLLHAVFAQAPVPFLVVDADSTIRRANSAACELLGVGPGYVTGKALTSMVEAPGQAPLRSPFVCLAFAGTTTASWWQFAPGRVRRTGLRPRGLLAGTGAVARAPMTVIRRSRRSPGGRTCWRRHRGCCWRTQPPVSR